MTPIPNVIVIHAVRSVMEDILYMAFNLCIYFNSAEKEE
jgi:hypothetical protein